MKTLSNISIKKLQFMLFVFLYSHVAKTQSFTGFTVLSTNGFYITCTYPTKTLTAVSAYTGTINYTWASAGSTLTGASVTVSNPGSYTVTGTSGNTSHSLQIVVLSDTVAPSLFTPPPFQINCFPHPDPLDLNVYSINSNTITGLLYFSWSGPSIVAPIPSNSALITVNGPGIYTLTATTPAGCRTVVQVTVNGCYTDLGENIILNDGVALIPNPFSDQLKLELKTNPGNVTLKIYSSLGVLVKTMTITEKQADIDLKNEPCGIYFVYVLDGQNAIKMAKLLKN